MVQVWIWATSTEPAHVHGLQPAAIGLFAVAAMLVAYVVAKSRREVGALISPAGAESSALRDEPPAIADLLVHSTVSTRDGFVATLLHLAYRQVAEVIESPAGTYAIRLRTGGDEVCSRSERIALAALRAPATAGDTLSLRRGFPWYRRAAFYRAVMDEAVGRGLMVRQRAILPDRAIQLAALAAAVGLWLFGFSTRNAFVIAAAGVLVFWAPFVLVGLRRRGVLTPAGREAASQWLGVRKYLVNDPEFEHAPPTAVVVWGPYLAYAVALGATDLDFAIAEPEVSTAPTPTTGKGGGS